MIHSIRQKLFLSISLLIIFFVVFSWVLNTHYLERYYVSQKSAQLHDYAREIETLINQQPEDLFLQLELMERYDNLNILVLNNSLELKYATFSRRGPGLRIEMVLGRIQQLKGSDYIEEIALDPFSENRSLNLAMLMKSGDYLLLSTPLAPIQESASIANAFFLYTGIATLLLALLFIFAFSRRFTRPILELQNIAQHMAHLDFSQNYQVTSKDELGDLGQSINSMSAQLSQTIQELQEANARLQKDIEKERQIDEMRRQFISNVSHELKTPISLIQGYAEGLKVNVVQEESEKDYYCSVIIDEADKMNKLVRELLDLSQVETGNFKLVKSPFDLAVLVDKITAKYRPIFEEKQVKPEIIKPEEIMVNADMVRTEQILINYINNALAHVDDRKQLKLMITQQGDKIHISLFNSGEPIPEESLDKLFTSFYKVDQARTRSDGGSGIGLAVVKAIQEKDHNRYGVKNREGGVSFWFELDAAGHE